MSAYCTQPFVNVAEVSEEPWQIPAFFARDLYPTEYRKPTTCQLSQAIRNESRLTIATAKSTRTPKGGTEVTIGNFSPTPFDYVSKRIVQPHDVRLERIYTRSRERPNKYRSGSGAVFFDA